jgi:hypothetical protein
MAGYSCIHVIMFMSRRPDEPLGFRPKLARIGVSHTKKDHGTRKVFLQLT